jgi:hypothetical protein
VWALAHASEQGQFPDVKGSRAVDELDGACATCILAPCHLMSVICAGCSAGGRRPASISQPASGSTTRHRMPYDVRWPPSTRPSPPAGPTASRRPGWLVDIAERLGGLLAGQVADDEDLPERLWVDALCVPAERAAQLAQAVEQDWPDPDLGEAALDLALAEGWERWDAEQPVGPAVAGSCWTACRPPSSSWDCGGTEVHTGWLKAGLTS